ncbi:MAG: hypothetical protein ACK4NE_00050 [Albidovulum sp.]
MTFDGKEFGREMVDIVKDYVSAEARPLLDRIKALEARPAPVGIADAIKSSAGVLILTLTDGRTIDTGIRDGVKGEDPAPLPDIAAMVAEAVEKEANRLAAKAGPQVVTMTFDAESLRQEIATLADRVKAIDVAEAVNAAVAALPKPQDGKSVTAEELRPLVTEAVSAAVSALPKAKDGEDGRDGLGLADALIDRDGNLVLTMTDGRHKNMGRVVGEPGKPGDPGAPGLDGVSMSHFDTEMKDERTIVFKFVRDDSIVEMHEFSFPVLIDRGVWSDGKAYVRGDCCTWGGSLWIAQRSTEQKPDSPDSGWRLAVKKGRDGRDGVVKTDQPVKVKV